MKFGLYIIRILTNGCNRSLPEITLFPQSKSSIDLLTNSLMPFPFAFARLNALHAAVRHSHNCHCRCRCRCHLFEPFPKDTYKMYPCLGYHLQQSPTSQIHTIPDYYELPYVIPTYATPCSIVENAAYGFSPTWHVIAMNT